MKSDWAGTENSNHPLARDIFHYRRSDVNSRWRICRRKMRMAGLCKVEMSAFMDGRGPHGNGANHFEPTRTGPIESVARGTAEASDAGSRRRAAESDRPSGT